MAKNENGNKKEALCPYNNTVICGNTSNCNRCGWNPEVAAARLKAYEKARRCQSWKIENPEAG